VKLSIAHGFDSMTKGEIEILVFHLLLESEKMKNLSNYHIANTLHIPETKVKSLRLNASLKYQTVDHKSVLKNIVEKIIDQMVRGKQLFPFHL
jgi:hypothetical protein